MTTTMIYEAFVASRCRIGNALTVKSSVLLDAYKQFNNGSGVGKNNFGKYLLTLSGITRGKNVYNGIGLVQEPTIQVPVIDEPITQMKQVEVKPAKTEIIQESLSEDAYRMMKLELKRMEIETNRQTMIETTAMKCNTKQKIAEDKMILVREGMVMAKEIHRERIQHEKEENNKNRNLMTYNTYCDNWGKDGYVSVVGTPSNWKLKSSEVLKAIEANKDEDVSINDLTTAATLVAKASENMVMSSGKVETVLDPKHLYYVDDILSGRKVSMDEDDKTLVMAVPNETDDSSIDIIQSINTDDEIKYEPKEYEFIFDDDQFTCDQKNKLEDLLKQVSDIVSDGQRIFEVCVYTHKQKSSLTKSLKGERNVLARLIKYATHCKSELITRSSVRTATEQLRDSMNEKSNKRKSMVKDIVSLMKPRNNFDSESGMFNCAICHRLLNVYSDDIERLHIVARSDGGDCSSDNLIPGCRECNRKTGRVNPIDLHEV